MRSDYHDPVLFQESLEGLAIKSDGTYVDVTFGGGGHSRGILNELENGRLIAFDQDPDAQANALDDKRFDLVPQNFRFMKNYLQFMKALPVDGVLADLGVSSHQFNQASRGFTIREDGPLDMRMNPKSGKSAAQFVAEADVEELSKTFKLYGELKNGYRIAQDIVKARANDPLDTTQKLIEALRHLEPPRKQSQFRARVFQALRIAVNDEISTLEDWLKQLTDTVAVGGRVVVISYHSLEDRLVKNFLRSGNLEGKQEKDFFGNLIRPFQPIQQKIIVPTAEEIERNPRARSAKMRIAKRINEQ